MIYEVRRASVQCSLKTRRLEGVNSKMHARTQLIPRPQTFIHSESSSLSPVIRIVREGVERLTEYESVPIAFEVRSKLSLPALKIGRFVEDPVEPFVKNYDDSEADRPTSLPERLGVDSLAVISAYKNDDRVGGAILYFPSEDEAQLIDLRVHPEARRGGLGRRIVQSALAEVSHRGIPTLEIETQDTNVAACRFYHSLGASLVWIEPNGYTGFSDEAKIIWSLLSGV